MYGAMHDGATPEFGTFRTSPTLGVERLRPLFHLFNGDLCYANLAADRVRTWRDFWDNNTRSARNRPSPGNHENELGNGPIGYQAYQTYFSVPEASGQTDVTRGLWYAFTAGSVRVISIANAKPAAVATDVIDTTKGTVHMVIGVAERPFRRTSFSSIRRSAG